MVCRKITLIDSALINKAAAGVAQFHIQHFSRVALLQIGQSRLMLAAWPCWMAIWLVADRDQTVLRIHRRTAHRNCCRQELSLPADENQPRLNFVIIAVAFVRRRLLRHKTMSVTMKGRENEKATA